MSSFNHAQDLFDHIALNAGKITDESTLNKNVERFKYNVKESNLFCNVNPDETPLASGAKAFVKRCVRKCISWYIRPAFHKQRSFNLVVSHSLNDLNAILTIICSKLSSTSAAVEAVQLQQEELSARLTMLSSKIDALRVKADPQNDKGADL